MNFYNPYGISRKPATAEGHSGENVFVYVPFVGYWSPNGVELTFNSGELVQQASKPAVGLARPDTFRKDASSCNVAPSVI